MDIVRAVHRTIGWAAMIAAVIIIGGSVPPAAAETATLPPAPYKPLPVGTTVKFNDRSYVVTRNEGFLTVFKARTEGKRSWLRRSKNQEGWLHAYGLFGEYANNIHVFDSRGDVIQYEIDSDEQEKLRAFWPLEVGKKVQFELEEGPGECTDPDEWEISLEVSKVETVKIGDREYATYVIEEKGESDSGKIYKGRRWYQPDAGLIVKVEREWIKSFAVRPIMAEMSGFQGFGAGIAFGGGGMGGGNANPLCAGTTYVKEPQFGEGEREDYTLVKAAFPEGTTTHALKGTETGGEAEAVVAEVRRLKQEVEAVQVARETAGGAKSVTVPGLEDVEFGRYYALVIGIEKYKHMPKLETAVKDATAVAKVLSEDYGFKVTLLLDPDRPDIIDALDELRETLGSNDNLLIYYAGRGWLDEEADRGYWLPVNARSNRRSHWVSNADITDTLKTLQAKHVLVVADSCYSGTLTRAAGVGLHSGDYWKRMATKWARVAITSGALEPRSGKDDHSPFATAFMDALKANDAILDGTKLFSTMRRPLMVATQLTPRYSDVRNAGHDGGDFLFVRRR
ncbi:MAG: caspase domain-containing protein [Rhodospirillales bacterium]